MADVLSDILRAADPEGFSRAVQLAAGKRWPTEPMDWDEVAVCVANLIDGDPDASSEAARRLAHMGEAGRIILLAEGRSPIPRVRAAVASGLARMDRVRDDELVLMVELLSDPDPDIRIEACVPFECHGTRAGRSGVESLALILRNGMAAGDSRAVFEAINALARIGIPAGGAAPALVAFIQEAGKAPAIWAPILISRAIDAIGRVASCNGSDVEVLREKLQDFKAVTSAALGSYGRCALPAVPDLRAFLDDPDPEVRRQAASALLRIEPSEKAIVILTGLAVAAERDIRIQALVGLGGLRRHSAKTSERLRARVNDPETGVSALLDSLAYQDVKDAGAILSALRGYGPLAAKAAPILRDYLKEADPWTQLDAARALARVVPEGEAPSVLASLARHPLPEIRKAAVLGLAEVAPPGKDAIALLLAIQDDPDPEVAQTASFATDYLLDDASDF